MPIDDVMHYDKRRVEVHGHELAYVEAGRDDGPPIVLLHGNPTSSFLWRNVIPHLEPLGRCLAPDLIGMGDSDKLPDPGPETYRFVEHRRFLDGFLAAVEADRDVTFVVHDWGSGLGFDWGRRHPDAVRGLAYMEAIVRPLTWDEWPDAATDIFRAMRGDDGETICLDKNVFVERILPSSVLRDLPERVMEVYRAPYRERSDRWPTLTWPRELPIDGRPADVAELVGGYSRWLARTEVPKLFLNADPGTILTGAQREFCRGWPNQREVSVEGLHFVQEDSPASIGRAVAEWCQSL